MCRKKNRCRRVLVILACLKTQDSVLNHIVSADTVSAADLVQLHDEVKALHPPAVDGDGDTLLKAQRYLLGRVGSVLLRDRPAVDIVVGVNRRVFQNAALDTSAPAVFVDGIRLCLDNRHRNVVLCGIIHLPLAGEVHLTHRCDNLETRLSEDEIETELVVSFTRAAVCDGIRAFLLCNLYDFFGNKRAGKRRSHRVALVGAVRLYRRKKLFLDEFVPDIDCVVFVGDLVSFVRRHLHVFGRLTDIDCDRNYFIIAVMLF